VVYINNGIVSSTLTDMSDLDQNLMHQLGRLRVSSQSKTPAVLALSQHFNHLDTLEIRPDPIEIIFANALSAELAAKSSFKSGDYSRAMQCGRQALQIYINMLDYVKFPMQKTVLEALISACKELITVFNASEHASICFHRTQSELSTEFSRRLDAKEAMDHIDRLDCSIEMYNAALQKRSDSMATVQSWGGYLQRPAKDMSIVNLLRVHYKIAPHVEKFDSDREYMR